MRYHFVTFASSDLGSTLERIKSEALAVNFFHSIHCLNEMDLSSDFRTEFRKKLKFGTRGYGYWCWKPQILLQVLEGCTEGDFILYCDAGCRITERAQPVLQSYIDAARSSRDGFCVFTLDPTGYDTPHQRDDFFEERWTKEDLFQYFCIEKNDPIRKQPQVVSGVFILRVCKESIETINKWRSVYSENFDLATDGKSKIKNCSQFKENRHDQSIFSLLISRKSTARLSFFELASECVAPREEGVFAVRDKKFSFLTRKRRQLGKLLRKINRIIT